MTNGPFLYDDDPAPLHTGTPRSGQRILIAILAGTVLVAVGMVAAMLLVKGSPDEQAEEVAGVFLTALDQYDVETAAGLLCEEARLGLSPEEALEPYTRAMGGTVGQAHEAQVDSGPAKLIPVEAADGTTTELVLIPEGGPKVCGVR